jgi:hypothetical protein
MCLSNFPPAGSMIAYPKRCKKEDRKSLVLTAAALQDHITKSNRLDLSLTRASRSANNRTGFQCSSCGLSSGRSKPRRLAPIAATKDKQCVVDCWLKKEVTSGSASKNLDFHWAKSERECVLDPKPPPLTLAECLGLVRPPPPPLGEDEWQGVKDRSSERDDSRQPCPICRDAFGVKQQVILSCSHVFHRACLQAFERHSGKKCCPLCRQEKYQTRLIYEGAKQCRIQAAVRIQSCWRGYVVRCWYKNLRRTVPPNDPVLRERFFRQKLTDITDRIFGMSVREERELNSFFESIDQNVQNCRDVMRSYERQLLSAVTEGDWLAIRKKAEELQIGLCAICLGELSWQHNKGGTETKSLALLSCSHVYHLTCIQSLEHFSLSEHNACPVCRNVYVRLEV